MKRSCVQFALALYYFSFGFGRKIGMKKKMKIFIPPLSLYSTSLFSFHSLKKGREGEREWSFNYSCGARKRVYYSVHLFHEPF